jgi:hypothetical protein
MAGGKPLDLLDLGYCTICDTAMLEFAAVIAKMPASSRKTFNTSLRIKQVLSYDFQDIPNITNQSDLRRSECHAADFCAQHSPGVSGG